MAKVKIFIRDGAADAETLAKFLKLPGIEITVGSDLPMTTENVGKLRERYGSLRQVTGFRLSGTIPLGMTIFIFPSTEYKRAKEFVSTLSPLQRIYVLQSGFMDFERSDQFAVTSLQIVHEHLRILLKIPEKKKKTSSTSQSASRKTAKPEPEPETNPEEPEPEGGYPYEPEEQPF